MGFMRSLLSSIHMLCPHCEGINEIDDLEVSVCIEGTEVNRSADEGVFVYTCDQCKKEFKVTAELDVGVEAVVDGDGCTFNKDGKIGERMEEAMDIVERACASSEKD